VCWLSKTIEHLVLPTNITRQSNRAGKHKLAKVQASCSSPFPQPANVITMAANAAQSNNGVLRLHCLLAIPALTQFKKGLEHLVMDIATVMPSQRHTPMPSAALVSIPVNLVQYLNL
jgi:hypothetical protein